MKQLLDRIKAAGYRVNKQDVADLANYFKSNPHTGAASQALQDLGVVKADMASTILGLVEQNAILDFSTYKRQTTYVPTPNQTVVSNVHRHGRIIGVSSSSKHLTMGMNIIDSNVVNTASNTVGEPRIFNVTDYNGGFYQDCGTINWIGQKVLNFNQFVDGSIGSLIYQPVYQAVVALIDRIKAEQKFLKSLKTKAAVTTPVSIPDDVVAPVAEESAKEQVTEFTMEVDIELSEETYTSSDVSFDSHYQSERTLSFIKRMIDLSYSMVTPKPISGQWAPTTNKRIKKPVEELTIDGTLFKKCKRTVTK